MSDANVQVVFSASTGDLEAGISSAREALASLAAPIADISDKYAALGVALTQSHTQAMQAMREGDTAAYADSLRAAQEALSGQIKAEKDNLKARLDGYASDGSSAVETEADKRAAVEETYALELSLMNRKRDLVEGSSAQRQRIDNQIAQLERDESRDLLRLTQESLLEQYNLYAGFGQSVTGAFNSQLKGLVSGTTSWRTAMRNILVNLIVDFIEGGEKLAVQWLATEALKTSATAAGVAARTGLEQSGAAASLAVQGAAMIRSILGSSAETFAGVFGFLSPLMGPFAAGPAAAAQATVASAVGAVASADIGMYSVPADMLTLVHHNELIMPAAQAGAFRDLLSNRSDSGAASRNVSIAPTTHFHVNALDAGSVSQWMRSNSGEMLRAVDEAVRHGAHLGLRRFAGA